MVLLQIMCYSSPKNLVIFAKLLFTQAKFLITSFHWNTTFHPYLSPKFFLRIQSSLVELCSSLYIIFFAAVSHNIAIFTYGPRHYIRQCWLKQNKHFFKHYWSAQLHKEQQHTTQTQLNEHKLVICNSLIAWIAQ